MRLLIFLLVFLSVTNFALGDFWDMDAKTFNEQILNPILKGVPQGKHDEFKEKIGPVFEGIYRAQREKAKQQEKLRENTKERFLELLTFVANQQTGSNVTLPAYKTVNTDPNVLSSLNERFMELNPSYEQVKSLAQANEQMEQRRLDVNVVGQQTQWMTQHPPEKPSIFDLTPKQFVEQIQGPLLETIEDPAARSRFESELEEINNLIKRKQHKQVAEKLFTTLLAYGAMPAFGASLDGKTHRAGRAVMDTAKAEGQLVPHGLFPVYLLDLHLQFLAMNPTERQKASVRKDLEKRNPELAALFQPAPPPPPEPEPPKETSGPKEGASKPRPAPSQKTTSTAKPKFKAGSLEESQYKLNRSLEVGDSLFERALTEGFPQAQTIEEVSGNLNRLELRKQIELRALELFLRGEKEKLEKFRESLGELASEAGEGGKSLKTWAERFGKHLELLSSLGSVEALLRQKSIIEQKRILDKETERFLGFVDRVEAAVNRYNKGTGSADSCGDEFSGMSGG